MTPLRVKRLLLVAKYGGDCKSFYSHYLRLMYEHDPSPVVWCIGHAFLTEHGEKLLRELTE